MSPTCEVEFWIGDGHDASEEIARLGPRGRAKVAAVIEQMQSTPIGSFQSLKKTKQEKLWEYKARLPEGGLRVLFAYGKGGKIWCLGAFVKRNDKEGNKLLKHPYEKLAIAASQH